MNKKQKVVMQDIADRLSISKNSVSQALSGKDGVSEETKMKILQTADEMGYQYKKKQVSGANAPTKTIGLIASEFAFSMKNFFGEIYLSIEREAQKNGITLMIQSVSPSMRDRLIMPSFIQDGSVDGIFILSHISTEYIKQVIAQDIPSVLIDHHHPLLLSDAVLTNNRFGAYMAVKHLLDLGHRKIGLIGNIDASPSYLERWEGYILAMREHDAAVNQEHVFVDVIEDETRIDTVVRSIEQQPDAWFCLNDGFGYYVCSSLKALGYRIPEQIAICGFDNTHFSQMCIPKLTTMDIDIPFFAHKAFSQLLWRMQNPDEVYQEVLLPTALVKREST
ncbi:LacI family DNA-binding transcriptional regulator [Paenibacillus sp. LHD-117]|uniref:LacI family DNA-binding transcriptional regulator n=1 Tax=Paenibacillus sp. LHD-117 TaxID=3071412 RepID=UPI0027E19ED2|nr:LacI family DNA-binding transcriptional regulator [Paenibacillus sp. LHD-117]MDQ6420340.1 LacI family DNA-binding transcriptional regulator [Paenibacillus sp. LHD-117]